MTESTNIPGPPAEQEGKYHTYTTHRIPWYVRLAWVLFWVGCVWYIVVYAIPMAKNYF